MQFQPLGGFRQSKVAVQHLHSHAPVPIRQQSHPVLQLVTLPQLGLLCSQLHAPGAGPPSPANTTAENSPTARRPVVTRSHSERMVIMRKSS